MKRALLAILGDHLAPGRSDKDADAEEDEEDEEPSPESGKDVYSDADTYAKEAFDALEAKDRDGFVEAIKGLVRCAHEDTHDEE